MNRRRGALQSRERKWIKLVLEQRDGKKCSCPGLLPFCKNKHPVSGSGTGCVCDRLEIHHIDNNWRNQDPKNLILLCSSCNSAYREWEKAQKRVLSVSNDFGKFMENMKKIPDQVVHQLAGQGSTVSDKTQTDIPNSATERILAEVNYDEGSTEMKVTSKAWRPYIKWIGEYLDKKNRIRKAEAIDSGSWVVGVSTTTIYRYLRPLKSESGPLIEYTDSVGNRWISRKEYYNEKVKGLFKNPEITLEEGDPVK